MKNTKKILCVLFALVALTFVMAISAFATEYEAGSYADLKTAMGKAVDGDVIKITAGFVIPDVYVISKGVTIDFNGNTLETTNGWSGLNIKNAGCSLINGKLLHTGRTCAIKVWNADKIENLEIEIRYNGANGAKTIGGIVMQESETTHINSIKNVRIHDTNTSENTTTRGLEINLCGRVEENIIGSMENVTVDVNNTGMLITGGRCGTFTNCSISGDKVGIQIDTKNDSTYYASVDLEGCTVEGGEKAFYSANTAGNITVEADATSSFESESGVAFDFAKADVVESFEVDGYYLNNDGSVADHLHNYEETGREDATCANKGSISYVCTICGYETTEEIATLEHSYVETDRVNATLEAEGSITYTCSACGATKTEVIPKLVPTEFAVYNIQDFKNAYTNAVDGDIIRFMTDVDFTSDTRYYCYVDKAITIDLNGKTITQKFVSGSMIALRNAGASLTSSAKDENGNIVRGTIIHQSVNHVLRVRKANVIENVNLVVDNCKSGGLNFMSDANGIKLIKNVHIYTTETGTLTYGIETYNCGLSECVVEKMEDVVVEDATTYGLQINCTFGEVVNCEFYGDQAGIFIWTKGGYKADLNLTDCEVKSATTAVQVHIDQMKNGSIKFAADEATTLESTTGTVFTTTYNANNNAEYKDVTIDVDVDGFEVSADGKVVCENNHNYSEVVTAPTCGKAGYTTHTCTVCGDTYKDNEVPATEEHSYIESGRTETEVTYTCDVCGDSYTEEINTHTHTEEIIPAVLPTPSVTGMTAGVKCSACGETLVAPTEIALTLTSDYEVFGIQEMTLSLASNIAINYKLNVPSGYKNVYMVFVYEGAEYVVNEYTVDGAYYSFKFDETRPHKMASNVAAYVYGETEEGYTYDYIEKYSIMQYCINQLKRNPKAELRTVISDVLAYGAAVQKYVYGDKIADSELVTTIVGKDYTLTPTAFSGVPSGNQITYVDKEPAEYYWTQVSLMLGSTTEMYYRFKANSIEGLQIKVEYSDQVVIYTEEDIVDEGKGVYRISVDCLTSMQYIYDVKATFIVNGEEASSMTDSINSYLYRQIDKNTGNTQAVMKALYVYGQTVRSYFSK